MKNFNKITAITLSFICLCSFVPNALADESEVIVNEDFSGETVPKGFYYAEENGTTLTVSDGQLKYHRPNTVNAIGELWYDLSELGSLSELHCNKVIFEYDVAYEALRMDGINYYNSTPGVTDKDGKKYLDVYIQVTQSKNTIEFVSRPDWTKISCKTWNSSETDTDVYYKTRLTIDIANSKQTLEVAEAEVGSDEETVYTSFGTRDFSEAVDGSPVKFYFIQPDKWKNADISIDNFKIIKAEPWAKMELVSVSPKNGSEFKSNKPEITVQFTNLIDEDTASAISLKDEDGSTVETEITVSGNKATIVPKDYLTYSTFYYLEIGEGIKDTAGQNLVSDTVYTYTTMPDPTDRNGIIYAKDTFENAETIKDYSWTDDGKTTAAIENGVLKYEHKEGVQAAAHIEKKLDIPKDTAEKLVFEYDLYPINLRHDKKTAYEFEFPGVVDDNGELYCDYYVLPMENNSTTFKLVNHKGGTIDTEFKIGPDYMYHVTLMLDMVNGKSKAIYEQNGLADGSVRTIVCPWSDFYQAGVNGNVSALRFTGGSQWGYSQINIDNFLCYSPDAVEYDEKNSNITDGTKDFAARSSIELSFTNPLGDGWENAIKVTDENGKAEELEMTLKNGGRTVSIIPKTGKFQYSTNYTVEIAKDIITDTFGQSLAQEKKISFTTGKLPPAKIKFTNAPTYKMLDEEGKEVIDITLAQKVIAELNGIENISDDEDSKRTVTLIIGIYDEKGNLRKYASEEKLLEKGNSADLTVESVIDAGVKEGYNVRVYIWDGIPGASYGL